MRTALENLLPQGATELFKYQVLVDHLKFEEAKLVADSFLNSPRPYTNTMSALNEKYGQPHQIALRKIASVLDSPDVRRGDTAAIERFALHVQSLVGLLKTLGTEREVELHCGSHVVRLLSKLPPEQRADFRRSTLKESGTVPTLLDLAQWLQYESWCMDFDGQTASKGPKEKQVYRSEGRHGKWSVSVLHGSKDIKGSSKKTGSTKGQKGRAILPLL